MKKKRGRKALPKGMATTVRALRANVPEWGSWGTAAERAGMKRHTWIRAMLNEAASK